MSNKYKELKYKGEIYIKAHDIDEILSSNDLSWVINCEMANASIEIYKDNFIFNNGIFYNGYWLFGAFRNGEWRFGTFENGIWFNGIWRDGLFKSGIIKSGTFYEGQFLNVNINPSPEDAKKLYFINCDISPTAKVNQYVNINTGSYNQKFSELELPDTNANIDIKSVVTDPRSDKSKPLTDILYPVGPYPLRQYRYYI